MASLREKLRLRVRQSRRLGEWWVTILDDARNLSSPAGRARLHTRLRYGRRLHQITEYTEPERYPLLFDLAQSICPNAMRILSFGCSTGEEIEALRRRFPEATIVGAELNARSRRAAKDRLRDDHGVLILSSYHSEPLFDAIFALAVLQSRPHMVDGSGITDLSGIYPFARFESEVVRLVDHLKPGGFMCVMHAQYRIEDTLALQKLVALPASPRLSVPIFDCDSTLSDALPGLSMFRKICSSEP